MAGGRGGSKPFLYCRTSANEIGMHVSLRLPTQAMAHLLQRIKHMAENSNTKKDKAKQKSHLN